MRQDDREAMKHVSDLWYSKLLQTYKSPKAHQRSLKDLGKLRKTL